MNDKPVAEVIVTVTLQPGMDAERFAAELRERERQSEGAIAAIIQRITEALSEPSPLVKWQRRG